MNITIIWILIALGGHNRPPVVIHKFPDQVSCQEALKSLGSLWENSYKCIPAKTIVKREEV